MNPMQTHVKVLAVLHIVFGILGVLIGLLAFAVMGGTAALIHMDHDSDAAVAVPMMGAIGGFVLILFLVLSLPGLIGGIGLLSFKPWSRILTIVVSIVDLINIPFGTALGIYGLWVLFNEDGVRLFGETAPSRLQPQ
jgi:hypothetical protein